MAIVDLVMPKMGESIMEATILKWHKQPGDSVMQDETLLEIATDKVDSEVPSTAAGTLQEILFRENDVVPVGSVIARIQSEISEPVRPVPLDSPSNANQVQAEDPQMETLRPSYELSGTVGRSPSSNGNGSGNRFYSPLVLNIASNEGISLQELEKLSGSGNEGRVTKKDILQYVHDKRHGVLAKSG